jgi:hypothetical protein
LERVPDRQAAELVKYHLGWKLALNLKLGADGFHPTTLVHFRQRFLEAGKSDLALRAVLKALEEEGFIARRSKHQFGLAVSSRFGRLISAIGHLFSPFMRSRLPRG